MNKLNNDLIMITTLMVAMFAFAVPAFAVSDTALQISGDISSGMKYLSAGLAFGLAAIAAGLAVGKAGAAGLAAVAGGISEALVATAIGLFVAIPAVMAYNYFTGRVESFVVEMDNSSSELVDYFLKRRAQSGND